MMMYIVFLTYREIEPWQQQQRKKAVPEIQRKTKKDNTM